ncbi:MAG TPA: DNA alkylation repair protein [Gaiellaceae bacterium]|nr:DNA alkylation repair protein [Gaiellaceae bacterium]
MPASATGVLRELKRLGTAQNVKIYRLHGAGENVYGVSFGDLRSLARKLGTDHELALALWDSGNADARCLATMVADPSAMARGEADAVGVFRPELAPEPAGRIGTVEVDHGETGCKTPAAAPYIERALARTKTPTTA